MKSAGKARNNGLYRHIRTSKEIIRNLLNDSTTHLSLNFEQRPGAGYFSARPRGLPGAPRAAALRGCSPPRQNVVF